MVVTVKVSGLRECEEALEAIGKSAGKAVLRRVMKKHLAPMAAAAAAGVRVDKGDLKRSIGVGTKLSRRQRSLHRKMFKDDRASVEMFVGAGPLKQAVTEEFGTVNEPGQAYLRPAFDAHKESMLDGLGKDTLEEIQKTAARQAKRAARRAV